VTGAIAFLGTGAAADLHTKTLRAIAPEVKRFYASRDGDRGAAAAARHAGAGHFADYASALASPEVTAVLVALPPAAHLEWTLRALAAGKHVIVEKPPFLRAADFDQVVAAASAARRQVLVAENYFYKPLAALLRSIVQHADLGQIRFIHLNALKAQPTGNWRDDPALAGGGALFEGGIHWVSLLANIGLTPARIHAALPAAAASDRNAAVTLEYEEGAVATLHYSWDLPGAINGVRFSQMYGTAGSVYFETNGIVALVTGRRPRVALRGLTDLAGYRGMMTDFLQSIRANRAPAYDLARARRDVRLIEEAYAAAALHR
jgi:UDP-N-acetylglucosamine 3-dehydrogenase